MRKRSFLLALAAALLACSFGTSNSMAGTVTVNEDAGTFVYSLTANGAGAFTISYSDVQLNVINNVTVPNIASTFGMATVDVTSTTPIGGGFTIYTLNEPVAASDTFGTGASKSAVLDNTVVSGNTNTGFLNLNGAVTGVVSPLLQLTPTSTIYDFSQYSAGASIALTYQDVGANFARVIEDGGTVLGTGGFSEIASVPEPSSMALLGIGASCLIAARRYFKRRSLA